jgi:hypothetical protein
MPITLGDVVLHREMKDMSEHDDDYEPWVHSCLLCGNQARKIAPLLVVKRVGPGNIITAWLCKEHRETFKHAWEDIGFILF